MKKAHLVLALFLLSMISGLYADSTTVQIFQQNYIHFGGGLQNDAGLYQELDNGRILARTIDLPRYENAVKITAHLIVNSAGDPWDRAGTIFLDVPGMEPVELLKFITGFGGYSDLSRDVSFLANVLNGPTTIKAFVDTWVNPGWSVSFQLIFQEDSTAQNASWTNGAYYRWSLTEAAVASDTPEVPVNIPQGRERVMMTYFTSGHCTDGQGADEFVSKTNVISIDDQIIHSYKPWRDDCRNFRDRNPRSGRWGNTWSSDLSRSGWCPGDIVYPVILDVTDQLVSGPHQLRYWIEDIRPADASGVGYWRVSSYLSGWGDISSWQPVRILFSGPEAASTYQTERAVNLRIDLVDAGGYNVLETASDVEISCDDPAVLFSRDGKDWQRPLSVSVAHGTALAWVKALKNGKYVLHARDISGQLPAADSLLFAVNDFEPKEGETNLALSAIKASADCECNPQTEKAAFAIDGSLATKWCCNNGGSDRLDVTFADSTEINYFIIRHAGAGQAPQGDPGAGDHSGLNTSDFKIQIPRADGSWRDIVSVAGNPGTEEGDVTYHLLDSPVKIKTFRLLVTDPGGDNATRIYEIEAYLRDMTAMAGHDNRSGMLPEAYAVYQNYPNPFNSSTVIPIAVPVYSRVQATIFDANGKKVKDILSGYLPRGLHELRWTGKSEQNIDVSSGTYFISVRFTGGAGQTILKSRKLIYVR